MPRIDPMCDAFGRGHNPTDCKRPRSRIFLLSPANTSPARGQLLLNRNSDFELARHLRGRGAPLGELFSFISSLYFRGKLAYAKTFSIAPTGFPPMLVMTTARGLLPPETIITIGDLLKMSQVPIDLSDARYRDPLCRDARALARALPANSQIVLLGSIASSKYVEPLLDIFGASLLFPREFVGRGDMSRGGLLLRCAQAGVELDYAPVDSTIRRGRRPSKLSPLRQSMRIAS
jgi:hypothetical protein